MITTIADLKGAFIANVIRSGGLPQGRAAYQDFEIAYFLNIAYDRIVRGKAEALQNMYEQIFSQGVPNASPRKDLRAGMILAELGQLYRTSNTVGEFSSWHLINERKYSLGGPNFRIFQMEKDNGFIPYILGVDLFELKGNTTVESWPCRLLSGPEQLTFAIPLKDSKARTPYKLCRLRPHSTIDIFSIFTTLFSDEKWTCYKQVYFIEMEHELRSGTNLEISVERIAHPQVISEDEITDGDDRELECALGWEIATEAAKIATQILKGDIGDPTQESKEFGMEAAHYSGK